MYSKEKDAICLDCQIVKLNRLLKLLIYQKWSCMQYKMLKCNPLLQAEQLFLEITKQQLG